MKILIADDHDVVRIGLRQILAETFPDAEVAESDCAKRLLELAAESDWDLIFTDIKMPGRSGLDVLPDLCRLAPGTPVIIITAFLESEYGTRALQYGAAGFINKSRVSTELPIAVSRVLAGGRYVSPQLAEALADQLGGHSASHPYSILSEREMQVTRLIATGRETAEIASELALSEKTIATYRSRIYEKLSVKNNVELARFALQHGLVE